MKKRVMMMMMLVVLWDVNLYAGRGGLCCCCDVDEDASLNRVPLIPKLGVKYIPSFEKFKKYYTVDGDCEIHTFRIGTIPIKEELRAGRGQKTLVYEYDDAFEKGPKVTFILEEDRLYEREA